MKAALFTNEFPPNIYGGAGIHIDFMSRELKKKIDVEVRCFGDQEVDEEHLKVQGVQSQVSDSSNPQQKMFEVLSRNLQMSQLTTDADLVHCHTWYSHFAGFLTKTLNNIPLIMTTHSLEPHRPWKVEQLGRGYNLSCWIEGNSYREADGIIAVSKDMKKDVVDSYGVDPDKVRVIYNGIDLDFYQPMKDPEILRKHGINPDQPMALFVGRVTRQKGINHLLKAAPLINHDCQLVLCAGAPDTPEIEAEFKELIAELKTKRPNVIWIDEMLDHKELRYLYSHADLFMTPSLYEPFGIINLEAMACGTPVVGSEVGGIPEIIIHGETGLLVPLQSKSKTDFEPKVPEQFHQDLAQGVNAILDDEELRTKMGIASRKRVEEVFSWTAIADQTLEFYQEVISQYQEDQA